jgi:hypothetical protein
MAPRVGFILNLNPLNIIDYFSLPRIFTLRFTQSSIRQGRLFIDVVRKHHFHTTFNNNFLIAYFRMSTTVSMF